MRHLWLILLLICPPSVFAAADSIVGIDSATGLQEVLSPEDALALVGGGEADTLQSVVSRGGTVTTAVSSETAVEIGGLKTYEDATYGPWIRPATDANARTYIWPTFNWCVFSLTLDRCMLTVDPGASTPKAKWQFASGDNPLKSFYLSARSFEGDGTQCPARPTVVTISNMAMPSFICTENNSARMRTWFPMPTDWNLGTILIQPFYSQTAADTGSVALEVAAACRALGTAFNGTYGTEVEVDDAAVVGSGAIEATTSAAVTPNGTCANGDNLFLYIDVDATDNPTTAAATLNFLGAKVFYSSTSLSH